MDCDQQGRPRRRLRTPEAVGNLLLVSAAVCALSASWSAPPAGADGYHVTYGCDAKQSRQLAALDHAATTITVTEATITPRPVLHRRRARPQSHPLRPLDQQRTAHNHITEPEPQTSSGSMTGW